MRGSSLLCRCNGRITHRYHLVNIRVGFTPMTSISGGPGGPMVGFHSFNDSPGEITRGITTCMGKLRSGNMVTIYGRFPKRKSARVSSRGTLPRLGFSHTHLSDVRLCPFGGTVRTKVNNIVMNRLRTPDLNSKPTSVSRRMVVRALVSRLHFRKLIIASTLRVGNVTKRSSIYTHTLVTKGSIILSPHGLGGRVSNIVSTLGGNHLSRTSVSQGYQGMLSFGCTLKLSS